MNQPRILYRHGQPVSAKVIALHGTRTASGGVQNVVWAGSGVARPVPASAELFHVVSDSAVDAFPVALVPATPEVVEVTLAGVPVDGVSVASVTDGTHTYSVTHTTGTLDDLATALAGAIDGNDGYTASAVGAVVTVSGATGYTLTDLSSDGVTASFAVIVAGSAEIPAVLGTGIQTVKVYYLNNGNPASESINLNGTTPVESTYPATAILAVVATAVGTGGKAAGNVIVTDPTDTTAYEAIAVGATESASVAYTVPTGKTFYIDRLTVSPGNATVGRVRLTATARPEAEEATGITYTIADFYAAQLTALDFHDAPLGPFPAGTQIAVTVAGDGALVAVDLLGYLDD